MNSPAQPVNFLYPTQASELGSPSLGPQRRSFVLGLRVPFGEHELPVFRDLPVAPGVMKQHPIAHSRPGRAGLRPVPRGLPRVLHGYPPPRASIRTRAAPRPPKPSDRQYAIDGNREGRDPPSTACTRLTKAHTTPPPLRAAGQSRRAPRIPMDQGLSSPCRAGEREVPAKRADGSWGRTHRAGAVLAGTVWPSEGHPPGQSLSPS